MKARDILESKGTETFSIGKDKSIHDAIVMMAAKRIGVLLVVENDGILGILSERDVINTCAKCSETERSEVSIASAMTKNVICASGDDDIISLMTMMKESHIRHVPIVNGTTIEGMVSMRDVVRALIEEMTSENKRLTEYIVGKYPG